MKIIHLVPGLMTGGQETMLINIANEQVKEHEVCVMIVNKDYDYNLLKLFDSNVKIVHINRPRSSKNPLYLLKLNWEIIKWHPFVVHLHYEKLIKYLYPVQYKTVYTIHDTTINSIDLKRNHNTVAISKSVQQDVIRRTKLRPILIYNGIKVGNILSSNAINRYEVNKPYRIVQVSRLAHLKKGQHILLEAFHILQAKGYNNLFLDFIGDGDSRQYLEQIIKEKGILNVNFLGNQTVEYINEHLRDYNLFVQASIFEGFGLTVAEAIAAKIPVLVSENEGPLEIIGNGQFGSTFKNGSAEDCAKKIEDILLTDEDLLQKRVDEAHDFINKNFSVKVTAANYIHYYQTCE